MRHLIVARWRHTIKFSIGSRCDPIDSAIHAIRDIKGPIHWGERDTFWIAGTEHRGIERGNNIVRSTMELVGSRIDLENVALDVIGYKKVIIRLIVCDAGRLIRKRRRIQSGE